jgi:chromatin remodeling complex protein RSC6
MKSSKQTTKQTKTTESAAAQAQPQVVSTPVPAPVQAATTTQDKAPRKSSKKVDAKTEEVTVSASPSTESVSVETLPEAEHAAAENANDIESKCLKFYSDLQEITGKLSVMKSLFKSIEREYGKKLKTASKGQGKKKSGNRAPSGFVKPTKISDELATFLGKPVGTEMARTDVTREINVYIRSNNLQDSTNGRQINANPALSSLLKLKEGDVLTYFNLQKYMSVHFIKAVPATV